MNRIITIIIAALAIIACADTDAPPTADAGVDTQLDTDTDADTTTELGTPGDCGDGGISYGDRCLRLDIDQCRPGITTTCVQVYPERMYISCDEPGGSIASVHMCDEGTQCLYGPDGEVSCTQ